MLELIDIQKSFDGQIVLSGVNFVVDDGTTHALIGSSGSGKTTLLRITLGLLPIDKGRITIGGRDLRSFTHAEWADQIGYVPQEGGLFPHLSAGQNVSLVARVRGWSNQRIQQRKKELSAALALGPDLLDRFPSELSGGQRQRMALMRAAFLDPPLLLLDEPMGSLDPLIRNALQDELKSIFRRLRKTVVIVTHDLAEAAYLAEKLTLIHKGRVLQTGTYRDFLTHPTDPFVQTFVRAYRTLPEPELPKWAAS